MGPLFTAASQGDLAGVQRLVEIEQCSVNASGLLPFSPLCAAARHGHAHVVAYLLDRGARVRRRDHGGRTALVEACAGGHLEVVEQLLKRGAGAELGCDSPKEWAFDPLVEAARHGHVHVLERLLREEGVCLWQRERGRRVMEAALARQHTGAVKLLIDSGYRPPISNSRGNVPMCEDWERACVVLSARHAQEISTAGARGACEWRRSELKRAAAEAVGDTFVAAEKKAEKSDVTLEVTRYVVRDLQAAHFFDIMRLIGFAVKAG